VANVGVSLLIVAFVVWTACLAGQPSSLVAHVRTSAAARDVTSISQASDALSNRG